MYQKPGDYQKAVHEETADFMMCVCLPGIPDGSVGKESPCDAGDPVSIPGLKRSPGEGKGYPLQYSGLENSMDYIYSPLGCRVEHNSVTFTFGGSHISALED